MVSGPGWTLSSDNACTLDSHSVVSVPTFGASSPQSLSGSLLLHSDIALEMPSTGEGGHVAEDGGEVHVHVCWDVYMYMYMYMYVPCVHLYNVHI